MWKTGKSDSMTTLTIVRLIKAFVQPVTTCAFTFVTTIYTKRMVLANTSLYYENVLKLKGNTSYERKVLLLANVECC